MAAGRTHRDQIHVLPTAESAWPGRLALGALWVHQLLCLTCGHLGCCDGPKNKHDNDEVAV
jgi:hypothetical protein